MSGSNHQGVQAQAELDGLDVRFLTGTFADRLRGLRRVIKDLQPHLVHTTIFEADLTGRLASVGLRAPVLTSLVNTSYDTVRFQDPLVPNWKLRVAKAADGWTARRLTTHFHAITRAVK